MLKKILIGLVGLVVVLFLVGLVLPTSYMFERSVVIAADKAKVHEYVGDLKRWPEWIPWAEGDPSLKTTVGDKTTGVGASQTWKDDSGAGRLTFTKCDANEGIAYDMAFIMGDKESPAKSAMTYKPAAAGGTEVVWTMEGDLNMPVFGGWMNLVMRPMMKSEFDKGLAKLKQKAESK